MTDIEVRRAATAAGRPGGRQLSTGPLRVRLAWWRSGRRRAALRDRPLATPATSGRHRLPGMRVDTLLHQALDPYGRPFGFVTVPATGHVSMTLDCAVPPNTLHDPASAEAWVADLGVWLALLAHEPAVAGCAVVVQRDDARAEDAGPAGPARPGPRPEQPAEQVAVQVLVQLTWLIGRLPGPGDPAGLAVEIGARLPRLIASLRACGVGTARPLTSGEVTYVVRNGYHPDPGDAWPERLRWPDAVPADHADHWQQFLHSGSGSTTWSMSQVPPSVVLSSVLTHLVAVPPDVARTRVTLLYHPAGERPGRRADRPADRADEDLPRFASLVTATSSGVPAEVAAAAATVLGGLPAPLRPWLRPLYGSQAAAFAAGLPTGTLLTAHAAAPGLLPGTQ